MEETATSTIETRETVDGKGSAKEAPHLMIFTMGGVVGVDPTLAVLAQEEEAVPMDFEVMVDLLPFTETKETVEVEVIAAVGKDFLEFPFWCAT